MWLLVDRNLYLVSIALVNFISQRIEEVSMKFSFIYISYLDRCQYESPICGCWQGKVIGKNACNGPFDIESQISFYGSFRIYIYFLIRMNINLNHLFLLLLIQRKPQRKLVELVNLIAQRIKEDLYKFQALASYSLLEINVTFNSNFVAAGRWKNRSKVGKIYIMEIQ